MHKIASNKEFRKALIAIALVGLMVIGPLGIMQKGSAAAPVDRGTRDQLILRVAMQDDIKTLNPISAGDVWTWNVIGWMFDGLTWRNSSNHDHVEPWAVDYFHHGSESTWDTSVGYPDNDKNTDYRNWTAKLTHGIKQVTTADGKTHTIQAIKWHDWQQFDTNGDGILDDTDATEKQGLVWAHDVIFSMRLVAHAPRYAGGVECVVARNDNGSMMYGSQLPANGTIQMINWDGTTVTKIPGAWVDLSAQKAYPDLPVIYVWSDKDDLTLHYFLTHNYPDFTVDTINPLVVPERIWKDHISANSHSGDPTWDDPKAIISFGPFKFGTWDKQGQVSRIDTFRDYFRPEFDQKGRMKPYIDSVLFNIYGTTDAAVMALTSNEVDYIAWAIDPGFIDTIVKDPDLALVRNADLGFFYVAFNMRKPEFGYSGYKEEGGDNPTYNGDYTDVGKQFRVAMAHLIDKQTIVTKFLQGFGSIGTSVVSPVNSQWYNPNIKIYNYDPDEANRILDQYAPDRDGSGYRVLPNRGSSEITMLTPPADYDPIRAQSGLMIQAAAKAAGLNFRSKPTNFGEIVNQIGQHTFDMYMLGWSIPTPLSSATAPCDFFGSKHDVTGGNNYPGYHNKSFDQLCDQMNRELDLNKRIQLSKKMQATIAEDVPYSVLYYRDVLEAYNKKFTGWVPRYGSIFNGDSLKEIRMSPPTNWEISISVPEKVEGGQEVPLDAYLYNKNTNEPISNVEITFSVPSGSYLGSDNTTTTLTAVTDANGKAEVMLTPVVPAGNTSISLTISASAYDEVADAPVKSIKTITVLPPVSSERNIEIQFLNAPASGIITIASGTPFNLQFKVVNANNPEEEYGELVNGTGVDIVAVPTPTSGASIEKSSFSNGVWTYTFTGTAAEGQTAVFVVTITATLMENNTQVPTHNDIQFTVTGPQKHIGNGGGGGSGGSTPSIGIIPILVSVGIAAVAYNQYRRKRRK